MKTYPYWWQGPGNGRIFDSDLENWKNHKMSERTIGVLEFLDDNPLISKTDFENQIANYLFEKYDMREEHDPNESTKGHFFRPLLFLGFIKNIDGELVLSKDGKNFLKNMLNEDYENAKKSFILELFRTYYPNPATKGNKLNLFPFRIMFKLLYEYERIHRNFFITKIPLIRDLNDVNSLKKDLENEEYLNKMNTITSKKLEKECKKMETNDYKIFYAKWHSWVMSPLVKINILNLNKGFYSLDDSVKGFIEHNLNHIPYEKMFYDSEVEFEDTKNEFGKKKRDKLVIKSVLEKSDYKCFFDENHETFPTNNRPHYVEGHHIIPLQWNDSYEEELDCEENIIALCPNCHKAMHYSTEDYKKMLLMKIFDKNKVFTNKFIKSEVDKTDILQCYLK